MSRCVGRMDQPLVKTHQRLDLQFAGGLPLLVGGGGDDREDAGGWDSDADADADERRAAKKPKAAAPPVRRAPRTPANTPSKPAPRAASPAPGRDRQELKAWSCSACTYANDGASKACQVCATPKPGTAASAASAASAYPSFLKSQQPAHHAQQQRVPAPPLHPSRPHDPLSASAHHSASQSPPAAAAWSFSLPARADAPHLLPGSASVSASPIKSAQSAQPAHAVPLSPAKLASKKFTQCQGHRADGQPCAQTRGLNERGLCPSHCNKNWFDDAFAGGESKAKGGAGADAAAQFEDDQEAVASDDDEDDEAAAEGQSDADLCAAKGLKYNPDKCGYLVHPKGKGGSKKWKQCANGPKANGRCHIDKHKKA